MQNTKQTKVRLVKRIIRFIIKAIIVIFFRLRVEGKENISESESVIITPNHSHWIDVFIISAAYKPDLCAVGKKEIFKNRFLSYLIRLTDSFPVDREGNNISTIKKCIKSLKQRSLILFPEGTRKKVEPKAGMILIASKANVKILPATIVSNFKLFSKITVIFHKPVDLNDEKYGELNKETYLEISKEIIDAIYSKIEEKNDH